MPGGLVRRPGVDEFQPLFSPPPPVPRGAGRGGGGTLTQDRAPTPRSRRVSEVDLRDRLLTETALPGPRAINTQPSAALDERAALLQAGRATAAGFGIPLQGSSNVERVTGERGFGLVAPGNVQLDPSAAPQQFSDASVANTIATSRAFRGSPIEQELAAARQAALDRGDVRSLRRSLQSPSERAAEARLRAQEEASNAIVNALRTGGLPASVALQTAALGNVDAETQIALAQLGLQQQQFFAEQQLGRATLEQTGVLTREQINQDEAESNRLASSRALASRVDLFSAIVPTLVGPTGTLDEEGRQRLAAIFGGLFGDSGLTGAPGVSEKKLKEALRQSLPDPKMVDKVFAEIKPRLGL